MGFDDYHGCASDHGSTNDDGGHRSSGCHDHGCTNDHGSTNDDGGHRSSRNDHGHTLGDNIRRVALVDAAHWFEATWDEAAHWLEAVSHGVRSFVLITQSVLWEKKRK